MKNTSHIISCLWLLISILYAHSAFAKEEPDLNYAFMPENFGLRIGMPESELLGALSKQGFAFNDEGKYKRVQGSKKYAPMLDYVLVIGEDAGGKAIWNVDFVVLGVKDGVLTAVGERNEFKRFDGLNAFEQTLAGLELSLGPSPGIFPNYQARKPTDYEPVNQLMSLIWSLEEKAPSDSDPKSRIWSHDDVMTVLTVRYGIEIDRRIDRYHRTLTLWHLDFCSISIMDTIFVKHEFDCSQ
jgi:hypothetical protein